VWLRRPEKRERSEEAVQGGPTSTEEADASKAKRPRTLPTPAPAPAPSLPPLEASGLLEAVIKREPEEVESLLAVGAEVGEEHRPDLIPIRASFYWTIASSCTPTGGTERAHSLMAKQTLLPRPDYSSIAGRFCLRWTRGTGTVSRRC
jgi:hypothetical protein